MKKIENIIVLVPLAPILFAVSFVLILFSHNIGELTLSRIVFPLLFVSVFSLIVSLLSTILLKKRSKGIFFSSIFTMLFFSYAEVLSFLGDFSFQQGAVHIGKNDMVFSVYIASIVLFFFLVKRIRISFTSLNRYLLILALFATLIPLFGIVRYEFIRRTQPQPENPFILSNVGGTFLDKKSFPDIYYIVPDSYTSEAILQKYFNYDNSTFISFLIEKGFYVVSQSSSNYPKTFLSLASSLNMSYLDFLSVYKNSTDQTLTDKLIQNNNVLRFLKSLDYYYFQMGSWWGSVHYNPNADDNFIIERKSLGDIGEFNYMIINSSLLSPLVSKFMPKAIIGESDDDKRARILYQFEELPNVAKLPGPKFVFAHIISPHGPYVFGKNCEFISYGQTTGIPDEQNYANQVNCINQKLEKTIDAIIKNSSYPPVILLQADEGPNFLNEKLTPPDNWKEASIEEVKEKFPILAAYYLPGKSTTILYPSITPVNSFRAILNLYFSTNLPLLPDRNYVFLDSEHLYEFQDITEKPQN